MVLGGTWSASGAKRAQKICRECASRVAAEWRRSNPDRNKANLKSWAERNSDRQSAYLKRWRVENRELYEEGRRRWASANPDKILASQNRRRARKIAALDPNRDDAKIAAIYALAAKLTALLGVTYHVDHLMPLAKGGKHHEDNLVVMRSDLNQAKSDHVIPDLIEFFTPTRTS